MQQDAGARKGSLVWQNLLLMAAIIAVVTLGVTFLSYGHIVDNVGEQVKGELNGYVVERAQREKAIFVLAQDNLNTLKTALLARIRGMGDQNPTREFDGSLPAAGRRGHPEPTRHVRQQRPGVRVRR